MIRKYIHAAVWVAKFQWGLSRFYFSWQIFDAIYKGLSPIVATYALSRFIAVVSQIAFNQEGVTAETAYLWLVILLLLAIVNHIETQIGVLINHRLTNKISIAGTELLISKMYALNQEQFESQTFNIKFDRARLSVSELRDITYGISRVVSQLITLCAALIAILAVAPLWIGGLFAATTATSILIKVRINNLHETMFQETRPLIRHSEYSEHLLINPKNMAEIRLMNAFGNMIKNWRKNKDEILELEHARQKKAYALDGITQTIQPLLEFAINIYFLRLLINGVLGLDNFIFLRGVLETATSNLNALVTWGGQLHSFGLDWQNFDEFFKTPPAIPIGKTDVKSPFTIEFQNVSFRYPDTDGMVLKNISFKVSQGEKLALVGENGSGKTTMVKLMMRQYLPTEGTIKINGTDIVDINPANYYAAVSSLSQEFLLIDHLTIKENLKIGASNELSDNDIYQALELVDAKTFIEAEPEKLEARLNPSFENGIDLSAGQKQRLSIARALLRNGDLIILDEPTSAVDAKAEYRIFNNIYHHCVGKTMLIISHRFSTVRQADTIIVLDKGQIIEQGTHSMLLSNNGLYKEMFDTQAEGYK